MFTRCTQCDAVFRVTLAQLQACSGQVRCGVCRTVFDAFVHLSAIDPRDDEGDISGQPDGADAASPGADLAVAEEVDASAPADPQPRGGRPDDGWPADFLVIPSAVDQDEDDAASALPEPADGTAAWDAPASAPAPQPAPRRGDRVDVAPSAAPAAYDDAAADAALLHDMQARAQGRRQIWRRVGVATLVLAVPLQLFVFFRGDLAMHWPASRAPLESACALFGCSVSLPHIPDSMIVESSELQALDPGRPNRAVLIIAMRNTASFVQAYPSMRLTLTDADSEVAAERIITPEEYLPTEVPVAAGLASGAVADIRVQLDTTSVRPAGFHIRLFHR